VAALYELSRNSARAMELAARVVQQFSNTRPKSEED